MAREGLFLEKMATKKAQRRVKIPVYQRLLNNEFTNIASNKCTKQAALTYILRSNPVYLVVPPHSPYRAQVQAIANAAVPPIPVASLSTELERSGPPRGGTFANKAAKCLDRIASQFDDMQWWIDEKGLVMDHLEPQSDLSDFDMAAGRLMFEHMQNGRLQKGGLEAVAKALDEKKYQLITALQPSHQKRIAKYNQEHPARALKTFEKAVDRPIGRRGVQLRLYVARDRYMKSENRP
jgi:hypothetical protein